MVVRMSVLNVFIVLAATFLGACALTIRLPRKNVLPLEHFKNAANAGDWYVFYYGTSGNVTFTNTKYTFTWTDPNMIAFERKADDGGCDVLSVNLTSYDMNKAVFISDGNYRSFVSSDRSEYMLLFECASISSIPRRCNIDDMTVVFLVKNIRPNSLPLKDALKDLKRNTDNALSFETTVSDFRFQFLGLEEPPCM